MREKSPTVQREEEEFEIFATITKENAKKIAKQLEKAPPGERWEERAVCGDPSIDPEIFFGGPEELSAIANREERTSIPKSKYDDLAKYICSLCLVKEQCLATTRKDDSGTRGGYTEVERTRMAQRKALAQAAQVLKISR